MLCRDCRHRTGVGIGLYLHLCNDGRIPRLDRRLGAGARIRNRGQCGLGRLVGLFRREHSRRDAGGHLAQLAIGRSTRAGRRGGRADQPAGNGHSLADYRPADHRYQRKRQVQCGAGGDQGHRADRVHRADADQSRLRGGAVQPLPPRRRVRRLRFRSGGGRRCGDDLLCLCGLRRGLDRGGGNQGPAAQRAARTGRLAAVLHPVLHPRCGRCDRDHRWPADHGPGRDTVPRGVGRTRTPMRAARTRRRAGLLE